MCSIIFESIFIHLFIYLVDDETVIDVVKKKVTELERENANWLIEGFPRTKVQALALEKLGVIPDKIINL